MTDMNTQLAIGQGNESPDMQSESSPPESCVYVSPESRTLAIESRSGRVRCSVCVLLVLVVLLAALFIITLAVSLFAIIALLQYQNALAFSSAATPLLPTTTSTASTPHIMTTSTVKSTSSTLLNTFTNVQTATGPAILIIISSSHGRPVYCTRKCTSERSREAREPK